MKSKYIVGTVLAVVFIVAVALVAKFIVFAPKKSASTVSITTASGSLVKKGPFLPGELIFEENFDTLNKSVWKHANTLSGSGNWEFQWYNPDESNSFTEDGILHIKPTLTSEIIGEENITAAVITIPELECTESLFWGCQRQGTPENILNPVRSARIDSASAFSFKYGRAEIRAKLPTGDWLWPALWFLPKNNSYGEWPASGEIDLMMSRGNFVKDRLFKEQVQKTTSGLNFGPDAGSQGAFNSQFSRIYVDGFNDTFRRYQMEWTPKYIKFSIDDEELGTIEVGEGFWTRGKFSGRGSPNPWKNGTMIAPFDQEFYVVMNVAVGGTNGYFPDSDDKPWSNSSPTGPKEFWNGRTQWLPTWNYEDKNSTQSSLLVDYVRVWAL